MNKQIKIKVFIVLLILTVSLSGYSQVLTDLTDIQKSVANFSADLAKSLPFNSSLGLNWADAYIGKFFPSVPPHFGIGASFGFTTLEMPVIKTLSGYFGYKLPFNTDKMFLPAYTAEARLGGFFLPFDIGFKFGYLPPLGLWGTNMKMNYMLAGGDIRFALLDRKVLPKISLGLGLNYMKSGIGGKAGQDIVIEYGGAADTICLERPEVNLDWSTVSLDFKLQISKSFVIITPYLGVGGSYAWSSAGYSVDTKVTSDGSASLTAAELADIKQYLRNSGVDALDLGNSGLSSTIKDSAFNFRAFGGLSVNLMAFRLDLTGLYSFRDKNYGASFGARLQL